MEIVYYFFFSDSKLSNGCIDFTMMRVFYLFIYICVCER